MQTFRWQPRSVALATLLALGGAIASGPACAQAAKTPQTIDIAAQPAVDALRKFVELTGFKLDYAPESLSQVRTVPVNGVLAPRDALARMLAGTGVQIVDTGTGAATLRLADAGSEVTKLETVVVTARKFNERMLDVPIAMSAYDADALRRRGATNLVDVLQDTPGVSTYEIGPTGQKVSIRGISTSLGANENGFYLDDLPFTGVTTSISPDVRAWDIERVEVLRGPQGTLFGEGSMGGTVRILTNNARLGEWGFAGQVGGSETQGGGPNGSAKAMLNVPLGDTFAVRAAVTHEDYSGWIDDPSTGRNNVNNERYETGRLRARWEPTERLTVNATLYHYDAHFGAAPYATDAGTLPLTLRTVDDTRDSLAGFSATYDFDAVSLFYAYANNSWQESITGPLLGGTSDITVNIKKVASHELRLSSIATKPLRWTAGLYHREAEREDSLVLNSPVIDLDETSPTRSVSDAVFAEGSYTLPSMPVELTAGGRYFRDHRTNQDINDGMSGPLNDNRFHSFNPRVSVAWHPDSDSTYYASASRGFRSGQIQPAAAVPIAAAFGITLPLTLNPDSIWTYELGSKLALVDRKLALEVAVYHSDWKDVTVSIPIATSGLSGYINSKGTKTNGVEANLVWATTRSLTLTLGGSLIDAEYAADVPGTAIVKGGQVSDVSRFTGSAAVDYRFALADWQATSRLGVQHFSKRTDSSFAFSQPGDAITNISARLGFSRGAWTYTLYGENLANDHGATSFRTVTPVSATEFDSYSPRLRPRTIGIELRYALGR